MPPKKETPTLTQKGLQDHLVGARTMLWEMIRFTPPKSFDQAKAAVDAYGHVDKALELCQKQLSQLPLPEPTTGGDTHDRPAA